jgi:hypothetical protein
MPDWIALCVLLHMPFSSCARLLHTLVPFWLQHKQQCEVGVSLMAVCQHWPYKSGHSQTFLLLQEENLVSFCGRCAI